MAARSDAEELRQPGVAQGLTIVIAGFLPILAIVSLFPAVPTLIDHFSADPSASWKVPWMVTAPGLAIALIAPFAGILVDRYGRRRLLLWSTFFYGLLGAAPFLLSSLDAVFGSRVLLGVTEAAILTTINTLIGDYWDDRGRRKWLAIQGMIGPFLASGLILLSGMLTGWRWNGVFLIYLVAFAIFAAMLVFLYEPKKDSTARAMLGIDEPRAATGFPVKDVAIIGAVTLFAGVLYYVFIVNGGMAFREVGVQSSAELGKMTAMPSLFVIVGSVLFWLTGRFGSHFQLACFLGLLGGGLALMGLAADWRWMVAGLIVQQTGAGMAVPTLIAWAQKKLPFEHRGRGMGVWTACFFFGQFVSPPVITGFRNLAGDMQGAFFAAGIAGLIGAAVGIVLTLRDRAAPALVEEGR